jgi:hypothetical protein
VRRESNTLASKVREALVEAMTDGALVLDPKEADPRAVIPSDRPAEAPQPAAARQKRPREAHPMPDAEELRREHLNH